jgi:hypothetical protein
MRPIGGVTILTRGVDPVPQPDLAVAPPQVNLGASVQASVHAFPLTNRPVAVVFRGPGSEEVVRVARTDTNRRMQVDFLPPSAGEWTAQARFMGDDRFAAAESNSVDFLVVDGGKGGVPGASDCLRLCPRDFILLLLVLVVAVLTFVLLLRHFRSAH